MRQCPLVANQECRQECGLCTRLTKDFDQRTSGHSEWLPQASFGKTRRGFNTVHKNTEPLRFPLGLIRSLFPLSDDLVNESVNGIGGCWINRVVEQRRV